MKRKGLLVPISGPSGVGKTTVCHELHQLVDRYIFSISCTTRASRANERDGVDYYFASKEEFEQYIREGLLAEWQEVFGNYYGTLKSTIREALNIGKILLLDIDVQGALNMKKLFPDETVSIFLLPPEGKELIRRLESRGTECKQSLAIRTARMDNELKLSEQFDHCVVNDKLDETIKTISNIIEGEIN